MNWLLEKYYENPDQLVVFDDQENQRFAKQLISECIDRNQLLSKADLVAIETDNTLDSFINYVAHIGAGIPSLLVDRNLKDDLKHKIYNLYQVSAIRSGSTFVRLRESGPPMDKDLNLLLSTSGSTGSPKFVRLSMANLKSNAKQIVQYLGLNDSDRAITTLPMHYSFGISILNSHLLAGGSICLTTRSIAEREFWEFFKARKPTSLSGVPTTYQMLHRLRFERMQLPSLRTMTQAGGRLGADLVTYFVRAGLSRGFRFYVMYGQTEATARMSYLPPEDALSNPESVGVAVPEGHFEIIDSSGMPIDGVGALGELVYHGPNVMMGYAESASDLASGDVCNGVLRTGDLAERDSNGLYYIRGRLKRFIKLFGNRVNLDEVEKGLQSRSFEVFVTGFDDNLIVCGLDPKTVTDAARQAIELYRFPVSGVDKIVIDEIPKSDSGKIQYSTLLGLYQKQLSSKS
jgi:long-chain acyl-CoA synthetase